VGQIENGLGQIVGFRGTRWQGTLYARNEWANGSHLLGALYAQVSAFGGGLEYGLLWPGIQGEVTVRADWHKPYWAIFETMAYNGTEDKVAVEISSVCNRRFNLQAGGGTRRVGITGTKTGFTSILANAEFYFNISIINPIVALNYGVDAEYIVFEKEKVGISGNLYNPVPYVSFEQHSIRAYVFYNWRKNWYWTFFLGETMNRIGGLKNPTWGVALKYFKTCPLAFEFDLSAYQFPSTIVEGSIAQFFTGTLSIKF